MRSIERELSKDAEDVRTEIEAIFERFVRRQPQLAARVTQTLARPLDDTAVALGYFLAAAVYLGFERAFGTRLGRVMEPSVEVVEATLRMEEELRIEHPEEPIDADDVVASEQPHLLAFIHHHVEVALEVGIEQDGTEVRDVDIDDVFAVFRMAVLEVLCLSYAVRPLDEPPGGARGVVGQA